MNRNVFVVFGLGLGLALQFWVDNCPVCGDLRSLLVVDVEKPWNWDFYLNIIQYGHTIEQLVSSKKLGKRV